MIEVEIKDTKTGHAFWSEYEDYDSMLKALGLIIMLKSTSVDSVADLVAAVASYAIRHPEIIKDKKGDHYGGQDRPQDKA